jgi:hypothetical protein
LGSNSGTQKFRQEVIRSWVEREVLNQISVENELLHENNFFRIIELNKKELSASIAIKDFLELNTDSVSNEELINYYNLNREDYSILDDAFIINLISFKNEESAIEFREIAIQESWAEAVARFEYDSSLVKILHNKFFNQSEIQSKKILRILQRLFINEISLVVNTELNNFVVVQQIDILTKNTTPEFNYVEDNVRESYIILKQQELVREYIDSLITKKKVKIY